MNTKRITYKIYFKNVISMKIILNNSNSNLKHIIKIHNIYNKLKIRFVSTLKILKTILKKDKSHSNNENNDYIQNIIIENFNIHYF